MPRPPARYSQRWAEFIRRRRGEQNRSAFAVSLGRSIGYVSDWENHGKVPSPEIVRAAAQALGDDLAEWLEAAGYSPSDVEDIRSAIVRPIEPRAAGAAPITVRGIVGDFGAISPAPNPPSWGDKAVQLAYSVETDTLAPYFLRGDCLLVKATVTASRGKVVIIEHDGQERLVRFVRARGDTLLVCPATAVDLSHPDELRGAQVRGIVVEVRRRL
jgi:transcriptional regulator with XRE-family HTH domain